MVACQWYNMVKHNFIKVALNEKTKGKRQKDMHSF